LFPLPINQKIDGSKYSLPFLEQKQVEAQVQL